MHNLIRNTKTVEKAFTETRKGLHSDKATFLDKYKTQYQDNCKDYDKKAAAGKLKDLKPVWTKSEDPKSEYQLSFNLYSSTRPIITDHHNYLVNKNSDKKFDDEELLCPMCSLRPVEETDHFSPRSIFPEYSCHLSNLIPLCHQCNSGKSDDWLDKSDKQIFFNAFYDKVSFENLFEVTVTFDAVNKTMIPKVDYNSSLDPDNNPIHYRVKESCKKLGLLKEYKSWTSSNLRSLTNRLKSSYKVTRKRYKSDQEFIEDHVKTWKDELDSDGFNLPIEKLLYTHLVKNTTLHSDLTKLFSK